MLAIITARGGSKRIPYKNIRLFENRPMISYAIELAKKSGLFDEIMVSTDDEKIAKISKEYGACVPFLRSAKNSDDFASTADVLLEVLKEYEKLGQTFKNFACIYPCVPLMSVEIFKKAYEKFLSENLDAIVPIQNFSYPPQRGFLLENGLLRYEREEFAAFRSQDLPTIYHDIGAFYFYKTAAFLNKNIKKCGGFVVDEKYAQDIDNEDDWKMAELKYRMIYA